MKEKKNSDSEHTFRIYIFKKTYCQIKTQSSVADPGCLFRIPDPNFFHPGSRVKKIRIPDPNPHERIKVFLTQKIVFKPSDDQGSSNRIPDLYFFVIPDPVVKKSNVADPGCLSRIPDPTFFHPGSQIRTVTIPEPGSRILKEFKYFNPKKNKKWFLSPKKYDPGCSSRIPDPDADFLPIQDPGSRGQKAPNPGSRVRIRNTAKKAPDPDPDPQH
jgi:hypothetical protein